jgi:tRNA dimethylallyltransferase
MAVYRGLDIGTAKPSPAERAAVRFFGLDLASPDESFSTGRYLEAVRASKAELAALPGPLWVVGGTGLYIHALVNGFSPSVPEASPALRAEAEFLLAREGLAALCARVRAFPAARLGAFHDWENPRRVLRAHEILSAGGSLGDDSARRPRAVALALPREVLKARIAARAEAMFAGGLVEETASLLAHGGLSATAAGAIGYREAAAVVRGECSREDAVRETARRTCRYAKRQMTFFRHRFDATWLSLSGDETAEEVAEKIAASGVPEEELEGL